MDNDVNGVDRKNDDAVLTKQGSVTPSPSFAHVKRAVCYPGTPD
ncbi:hypothetical protein [Amphritea sp. HPY]